MNNGLLSMPPNFGYGVPQSPITYYGPDGNMPMIPADSFQILQSKYESLMTMTMKQSEWIVEHQNKYFQKEEAALIKEKLKFETVQIGEDDIGHPIVIETNSAGDSVARPLSACRNFKVQCVYDSSIEKENIHIVFNSRDGTKKFFNILRESFTERLLYTEFSKVGGSLCYGKDSKTAYGLFYRYIAEKIASSEYMVVPSPGWHLLKDGWSFFPGEKYQLNKPLYSSSDLFNLGKTVHWLIGIASLIMSRLTNPKMYIDKPFFFTGSDYDSLGKMSMDEVPKRFMSFLETELDKPVVHIFAGSLTASSTYNSNYRLKENYANLMTHIAQKHPNAIYALYAKEINPLGFQFCLPVSLNNETSKSLRVVSKVQAPKPLIGEYINYVKNNSDEFEHCFESAFSKKLKEIDEEAPNRNIVATLSAALHTVVKFLELDYPHESERVLEQGERALTRYADYWDAELGNISERFKKAVYSAKRDDVFRFIDISFPGDCFDSESTVIYDNTYFYISKKLLKNILGTYMKEYETETVISALENDGIIGKSKKVYFTSPNSNYCEPRVRAIPKEFFYTPGELSIFDV